MNGLSNNEENRMSLVLKGIVHGNTIELNNPLGVADGQTVEVSVKIVPPSRPWGEGILHSAGALADDPYWDKIMYEIQRERQLQRGPQLEDA
jgi:hypothetical protein